MKKKEAAKQAAKTFCLPLNFSNKTFICLKHLFKKDSAGFNTHKANLKMLNTYLHSRIIRVFNNKSQRQYEVFTNFKSSYNYFFRYWPSQEQGQGQNVTELLVYLKNGATQ